MASTGPEGEATGWAAFAQWWEAWGAPIGVLLVTGAWDLWVAELRGWVGGFEVAV